MSTNQLIKNLCDRGFALPWSLEWCHDTIEAGPDCYDQYHELDNSTWAHKRHDGVYIPIAEEVALPAIADAVVEWMRGSGWEFAMHSNGQCDKWSAEFNSMDGKHHCHEDGPTSTLAIFHAALEATDAE